MKKGYVECSLIARIVHITVTSMIASQVHAGGFMLRDQSVSAMGSAFSSQASAVDDASAVYANPAAIGKFEKVMGGLVASSVSSDIEIGDVQGSTAGSADGDMLKEAVIPSLYGAVPVGADIVLGVGLYFPFGLSTNYEPTFRGRYFGDESSLKHTVVQPTIAWRLSDQWSIALDATYNRVKGVLSQAIPFGAADIWAKAEGDDESFGYGFGVLYSADRWSAGLVYRSSVDFTLRGDTTIAAFGIDDDSKIDFTTPAVVDLSLTWAPRPRTKLHASISRTGWHVFDELRVQAQELGDTVEVQDWRDANYYALGLTQEVDSRWFLRTGVGYDETPQPARTRSVRLADNDRIFLAVGGGYKANHWRADISALYIRQQDADVTQASTVDSFSGEYRTRIYTLAGQFTYLF